MTPSITAWPPTIRSRSGVLIGFSNVGENTNAGDGSRSLCDRAGSAGVQELIWLMCRGRGLGGFLAVTLIEAIDASCGIDEFLFAREERVASRTDFDVQITFLGGASLE